MNRIRTTLRLSRDDDAEAGLSLVEVIVAMMIFAIISVAAAGTITNSLVLSRQSQNRETAVNLASQTIDLYRSFNNVVDVENKVGTTDQTVSGIAFHIATAAGFTQSTSTSTATTACSVGTGALQYLHVTVTVTWDGMGSASPAYSDTEIAPNAPINNTTQGTIIVAVTGATGGGNAGVTVSAVPQAGQSTPASATTDVKGCAYIFKADPGLYDVTIAETGSIDIHQDTTPDQTVTVTAGASTSAAFTFDTAVNYTETFPTGATLPTNLTTSFVSSVGGVYAPATSLNPTPLFPFPDGYYTVAGSYVPAAGTSASCVDVDPANWTTVASDGAVGQPVAKYAYPTSEPVSMGVVTVSNLTKNYYLTAVTHTPPLLTQSGDPGCAIGATYKFPQQTGTASTIALPYGSWSLYQGSKAGSTTTLIASSSMTPVTRGTTTLLSGVLTLDPRTVPGS